MQNYKIEESLPPAGVPLFSICVPQYNRTSFLIRALQKFLEQDFQDFEFCISDGGSTDGRQQELIDFLKKSGRPFRFVQHHQNKRYDPNIRASIALASGRYCLLMGNDDMPATNSSLGLLAESLRSNEYAEVLIPNFLELGTNQTVRRIRQTGILGQGPEAALRYFRDFSFVSGICLDRAKCQALSTEKWDGSEMYQMFLGCRILAQGGRLLGLDQVLIYKDIQIPGESVDSYAKRVAPAALDIREVQLPLAQLPGLVCDAIRPTVSPSRYQQIVRKIFKQFLLFTCGFWFFEYRRVLSWSYAAGVCLGLRPKRILPTVDANLFTQFYVSILFWGVSFLGLIFPVRCFFGLKPFLYRMAKSFRG